MPTVSDPDVGPMVALTARLPSGQAAILARMAKAERRRPSELVRFAVEEFIAHHDTDPSKKSEAA